jgi:hypothetical protein
MNSPSSPIKLVFWNCASLAQRLKDGSILALLNPALTPDPPTILALVETRWVDQGPSSRPSQVRTARLPYIPNYTWTHRHHTFRSGGIAVLYHNSIACLAMPALNTQCAPLVNNPASPAAVLWLTMRYPHCPPFVLGVGYLPPSHAAPAEKVEGVRGMCAALGHASACQLPVVLVGDFNLHHPDWQDAMRPGVTMAAPVAFAEYVRDNDWTILNPLLMPGGITRPNLINADGYEAVIDLAVTDSPHLFTSMDTEYRHVLHSDHYPVTLTAVLSALATAPPTPTHTRQRTQWNIRHQPEVWQAALPSAVEEALRDWVALPTGPAPASGVGDPPTHSAQARIDQAYTSLEAVFTRTCERTVSTRVCSSKTKHWFNYPGIKLAYARMKHTRRVWKRSRRPCAVKAGAACAAMDAWKLVVREAQAASWTELCASVQASPSSKLQWTLFKRSRGRVASSLSSFPSAHGEAPLHVGESLNHLSDYFVSASTPPPLPVDSVDVDIVSDYMQPRLQPADVDGNPLPRHVSDNWTFTPAVVEEQCTRQHTTSAPGCDGIVPILLTYAGKAMYAALSNIFTYSWRHAVLPQQWTEANVMALYKGKGGRSDPASFRPISMTSIIIRTFEHLIHRRLSELLEQASFFHPLQFGFRKHHSTLDAINYLQYNTRTHYVRAVPCPTLFMDIHKAFDRVWHPKLLQTVENAGLTGRAWRWLHAFLSRRRFRTVDSNHQSEWRVMEYGVPQGAVLSPLLFNIFINSLAKRISTACPRLNFQLYADDIALQPRTLPLVNGRRSAAKPSQSRSHPVYDIDFPNAFRILDDWCTTTRMRFGEAKTEWVVFDKSRAAFDPAKYKQLKGFRLQVSGFVPRVVQEYKYLGVTHHRQLTWHTQATEALTRIRQDSHIICRLIHPPAAPHFPAIRALCLGYMRPRCTYAFAFWTPTVTQMRQMQAAFLRPIQRILGLPTSSHHLGALVEAHCPSFEAYRTQATARFLLRAEELLQSQPTHPTSQTLLQDRLEAPLLQRKRYCAGPLISTPVTNRAETVAIPHLINNVLAHLPRLAPFHPLISRYFPGAANLPAPLPATLTVDEVNSLLMVDTHREWRAEPTMTMASISTAPLLTIKTSPRPSLFLSLECNPLVAIRARLRANRLSTQERRYRQLHEVDDPTCTWPACRTFLPAPLDDAHHIFVVCPRHQAARQLLVHQLRAAINHTSPLTLAFISGEVLYYTEPTRAQLARAAAALALTGDFVRQVLIDRSGDRALKPFDTQQPMDLRPRLH